MTALPDRPSAGRLGLVIDLDTRVGCQACVIACKTRNSGGAAGRLADAEPYGRRASGTWLDRVHGFEVVEAEGGRTVSFPRSSLHCENAARVTVCPTGASYERTDDGIVPVDESRCIGCASRAWACAYGARELDPARA